MSEKATFAAIVSQVEGLERQQKKSERTRQAILSSALGFFWDHPFRELTIAELTARIDVSRPTFYQYFSDLYDLMAVLLEGLRSDILMAASPWFEGEGDPVPHLKAALTGLVNVCYERGPILRAVAEAAVSDANLEKAWEKFLKSFDEVVAGRIKQHQTQGLIEPFSAYPVAIALNRLDASLVIEYFGRRPRGNREEVLLVLTRVWTSTLYGLAGD